MAMNDILSEFGGIQNNSLLKIFENDNNHTFGNIPPSSYIDVNELIPILKKNENKFTLLSLNIQSLNAKFDQLKILIYGLNECGCNVDAICIQETWLSDTHDNAVFSLDGYNFISQPKSSSKHGGVAIYLSNIYNHNILPLYNESEIWDGQFIEVTTPPTHSNIVIGNIYRPPRDSNIIYETFINDLKPILQELNRKHCEIILCGDYNIDLLKMYDRPKFVDFFDTFCSYNYLPKITLPTRLGENSATLIDNFFSNLSVDCLTSPTYIITSQISDHMPYLMILNSVSKNIRPPKYIQITKMNAENIQRFQDKFESANIFENLEQNSMSNPNKNCNTIVENIRNIKAETMPTKKVKFKKHKHKHSNWITQGIICSIKYRDKLYTTLKKTHTSSEQYDTLKINLRTYNKILRQNIRNAKQIHYETCFNQYKHDIKSTWMTIKEVMGKGAKADKYPESFRHGNKTLTNKQDIVNHFNNFFTNLGPTLASKINNHSSKSYKNFLKNKTKTSFNFELVTEKEIEKTISELCPKNSFGHDEISTNHLKTLKKPISKSLALIVNQCLKTGIFPENLKLAKVIPIYKKGDPSDMNNYRPISLLPSISKVIEKVVSKQLTQYLIRNNLINMNQYGFRPGYSTELAALHVIDKVTKDLDKKLIPINIYLDLSKAFDTLNHEILLNKLNHYGVSNIELTFFRNYLSNRKQFVQMGDTKSSFEYIKTGVPQGSILGPLLFILYINELSSVSTFFKTVTYADDTTLMTSLNSDEIKNINEISNIISLELNKIIVWLELNRLSLNVSKSKFMIFHMPQKKFVAPSIKIYDTILERVNTFNFLGITLHEHLKWDTHIHHISNKICRVVGTLNKLKHYIPQNILQTIYNSLILSHLHYGVLLWGNDNLDRLLKLQKRAIRNIVNASYNAHSEPLFKTLNILKISDIHKLQQLKFLHKFLNHNLPEYFFSFSIIRNQDMHTYNTRYKEHVTTPKIKHEFARKCISNQIHTLINNTPDSITNTISTHSLHGYAIYIKRGIIDSYSPVCRLANCYICSRI